MDDDIQADGLDYAEDLRRERMARLRDEDGNQLYEVDEPETYQCECGIWWPVDELTDGLCPECREE